MISKIAIFNSKKHAKAIITLDKDSIQLVGENQIGKTTLIDTLNFLYCIKERYMSFDNNKYTFKQTLEHLFPSDKISYVVFESYTSSGGFQCILLKRNIDKLEYYKIDCSFDSLIFFEENGKIKDFSTLMDYLLINDIIHQKLNRDKLFDIFYSFDKSKNAIVWLKNTVQRKEFFAEIYQHLINSKSINAENLQKALIIANDRKRTILKVFTDTTKKDSLKQLRKIHQDIEIYKSIRTDFDTFKDCLLRFEASKEKVGNLFYTFQMYFNKRTQEINLKSKSIEEQVIIYEKINEEIDPKKSELNQEIGKLKAEIFTKKELVENSNKVLREIALLNPFNHSTEDLIASCEQELQSLEKQIKDVEYYISNIDKNNYSKKQIEVKLKDLRNKEESLILNIEGQENLLIYNLTKDNKQQKILHTLLSQKVLDKGKIIKSIANFSEIFKIFDGEIDITNVELENIKTVQELEEELTSTTDEIKELEKILGYVIDFDNKQTELQKLVNKKNTQENNIAKIKLKEPNENNVKKLNQEIDISTENLNEKTQKLKEFEDEIKGNRELIKKYSKQKEDFEKENTMLIANYKNFELEKIPELVCDYIPISNLDIFLTDFRKQIFNYKELEQKKSFLFHALKNKIGNEQSDEQMFIKNITNELETLEDREKQKQEHLKIISNQIIIPIIKYLADYKVFKRDFIKDFNKLVRKYPISRIEEMKIKIVDNESFIKELELISKVEKLEIGKRQQEFVFDSNDKEQTEALNLLDSYLNSAKSRVYQFSELFSIKIDAIYQDGSKREIDLKKQNESTGTIRMINLILFLLIIKYFKVDDDENKVVFFVDELTIDPKNIAELIQFCKENGFIAIFAANINGIGFEKYYFMKPSANNKGKVVLDETYTGTTKKYDD
jgi:hypothetical protein